MLAKKYLISNICKLLLLLLFEALIQNVRVQNLLIKDDNGKIVNHYNYVQLQLRPFLSNNR
jgi:hypothetical protein